MRLAVCLFAALLLAGCGLPTKERVQGDLQVVADAGAAPEAVTVEVTSMQRGEGDLSGINHHVGYDLIVWRNGPLIGPLVGGQVEGVAGQRWTGGRALIVYERGKGGAWRMTGLMLERPPSPPTAAVRP